MISTPFVKRAGRVALFTIAGLTIIAVALVAWLSRRTYDARQGLPYTTTAPLQIRRNDAVPLEDDIIGQLASDRSMVLQRGIGSIPVLSSFTITHKLKEITNIGVVPPAHFSINLPVLSQMSTHEYGVFGFGGFIIYDTNLENVKNLGDYKNFVTAMRRRFSFKIYVTVSDGSDATNGKYEVTVAPFVVADCDLSYGRMKYCRGPFLKSALTGADTPAEHDENIRKITAEFADIGLNSTLSPEVDVYDYSRPNLIVDLARTAAIAAHQHGMVPTLKHFMYDRNLGDAHYSSFYNPITDDQFEKGLAPYDAVDSLEIPYFIMLTHHRLPMDPSTPLPLSDSVRAFIRNRFKHAITMSDAINMGGVSKGRTLHDVVAKLKTDSFLFQSGNVSFSVSGIIRGLKDSFGSESVESTKRLLLLKREIGLLSIRKIG